MSLHGYDEPNVPLRMALVLFVLTIVFSLIQWTLK